MTMSTILMETELLFEQLSKAPHFGRKTHALFQISLGAKVLDSCHGQLATWGRVLMFLVPNRTRQARSLELDD